MSEAVDFTGLKKCPVCRKQFTVLWPGQWAYKRGDAEQSGVSVHVEVPEAI